MAGESHYRRRERVRGGNEGSLSDYRLREVGRQWQ